MAYIETILKKINKINTGLVPEKQMALTFFDDLTGNLIKEQSGELIKEFESVSQLNSILDSIIRVSENMHYIHLYKIKNTEQIFSIVNRYETQPNVDSIPFEIKYIKAIKIEVKL